MTDQPEWVSELHDSRIRMLKNMERHRRRGNYGRADMIQLDINWINAQLRERGWR